MKKSIALIIAMLVGFSSSIYSQIGAVKELPEDILVGEVTQPYKPVKLTYVMDEDDNKLYTLFFKNIEYEHIEDYGFISFYATTEELDYLYNEMYAATTSKTVKTIPIGDGTIMLSKMWGAKQVRVTVLKDGNIKRWTWLSRKQVKSLFNKD